MRVKLDDGTIINVAFKVWPGLTLQLGKEAIERTVKELLKDVQEGNQKNTGE